MYFLNLGVKGLTVPMKLPRSLSETCCLETRHGFLQRSQGSNFSVDYSRTGPVSERFTEPA